jgi:hypothetical protein
MSNLISCNLMGGLGNQLFEAAHTLSQGWKHNREVVFIPRSWTPGQGRGAENYINNVFRNLKFVDNLEGFTRVTEGPFEYSEVNPVEENTVFDGYFQSTKNWFGFDDQIREIFQPSQEVIDELRSKYPQLNQPKTLSIHVRRGEYLQFPEIHPTISVEYIQEALKIIGEYSTVFLFTEDESRWPGSRDFVMNNFSFPNVVFPNEDQDWKELYLMGLCENHIISNSTFSWWATFLNKNKNKKIVCPSRWFGPRGPKADDIYESYWNLVDVEWKDGLLIPKNK